MGRPELNLRFSLVHKKPLSAAGRQTLIIYKIWDLSRLGRPSQQINFFLGVHIS